MSIKDQIKLLAITDDVSAKFGSEDLQDDPLGDYEAFLDKMAMDVDILKSRSNTNHERSEPHSQENAQEMIS